MKRIIGMILVVVMLALSLASCGFNYSKEDMTEYATFNKDAFLTALQNLSIKDGDFTTDNAIRDRRVEDYVKTQLASKAGTDKLFTGTVGAYDVLYYNYYATAVVDGKTYTFYGDKMTEANALKLQLGLYDTEKANGLAWAIEQAFGKTITEAYDTDTSGTVKAGDKVRVSYTYKYDGMTSAKSVTYIEMTIPADKNATDEIGAKFIDESIGVKFSIVNDDDTVVQLDGYDVDGDGNPDPNAEITDVTVHWVEKTGESFDVHYTPYPSTEGSNGTDGTKFTPDEGGDKVQLYGVELTYHVYPTYYIDVAEISGKNIIKLLYGKNLTTSSFDVFTDNDDVKEAYKTAITEYVAAVKATESAKTALDSAKTNKATAESNLAKAEEGSDKTALEQAVTTATQAVTDAETTHNTKMGEEEVKLLALLAVEATTEADILAEYKSDKKESEILNYNEAIQLAIAKEINKLIETNVTIKTNDDGSLKLPKKAVDDAYDTLIEKHKADFYTGSDTETSKSFYSTYGNFKAYLVAKKSAADYDEALDKVRQDAEAYVSTYIKIFAVAQGVDDLLYTNKEYRKNASVDSLEASYGEINTRVGLQYQKILNHYLELNEDLIDDDGNITYVDDNGNTVEDGGKLPYVNIKYSVK